MDSPRKEAKLNSDLHGLEELVRQKLGPIPETMKSRADSSRAGWTREIKEQLCQLGRSLGYKVGASGCGADWGEWLYDMTWFEMWEDRIARLPLILESEWIFEGIEDDFYKLLQARADLRVLVFEGHNTAIVSKFDKLKSRLREFTDTSPRDRYLFAAFDWDGGEFIFDSFSVQQAQLSPGR